MFLFGGTPHCEDTVHRKQVVLGEVAAEEETGFFQQQSFDLKRQGEVLEELAHDCRGSGGVPVAHARVEAPQFARGAASYCARACHDHDP